MRAAVQHRYGPPSVLTSSEVGLPLPVRGDVLVQVDLVRSLGADHVVDYTRTDVTRTKKRHDVILDNVEPQPLAAVRRR